MTYRGGHSNENPRLIEAILNLRFQRMNAPRDTHGVDYRFLAQAHEALANAGVGALEFLAANPGVSPVTLAQRLDHGANAIGLVMAIYGAAAEKGKLRETAKTLLVGEILDAFPDGWPDTVKIHPLVKLNWCSHIKRHISPPRVGEYASRIIKELAIRNPPPSGWRPALTNDPLIDNLFDRFWPTGEIGASMDSEQYREFWRRRGMLRAEVLGYVRGAGVSRVLRESGLWEELLFAMVRRAELSLRRTLEKGELGDIVAELLNDLLDAYGDSDTDVMATLFAETSPGARDVEEWLFQQSKRAIAADGHSAVELLNTYPLLSLSELALVLNRGTCGLGLTVAVYRDAEARDQVRTAAKELLVRRIIKACRAGWTLGARDTVVKTGSWSFYIHRYLCDATIDGYASRIERELATIASPPAGWNPANGDDPSINEVFDRYWPAG